MKHTIAVALLLAGALMFWTMAALAALQGSPTYRGSIYGYRSPSTATDTLCRALDGTDTPCLPLGDTVLVRTFDEDSIPPAGIGTWCHAGADSVAYLFSTRDYAGANLLDSAAMDAELAKMVTPGCDSASIKAFTG